MDGIETPADYLRFKYGLVEYYLCREFWANGLPAKKARQIAENSFQAAGESLDRLLTPEQRDALNRKLFE